MDGSCGSDEDKPRRVIQQSFPEGGGAADGDIIPVVTITEDQACAIAAASATHVSGSRNPTGSSEWSEVKGKVQSPLEGTNRQLSEPLPPSTVREVLYGSRQRLGEGLIRRLSGQRRLSHTASSPSGPSSTENSTTALIASYSPSTPTETCHHDNSPLTETLPPSTSLSKYSNQVMMLVLICPVLLAVVDTSTNLQFYL